MNDCSSEHSIHYAMVPGLITGWFDRAVKCNVLVPYCLLIVRENNSRKCFLHDIETCQYSKVVYFFPTSFKLTAFALMLLVIC